MNSLGVLVLLICACVPTPVPSPTTPQEPAPKPANDSPASEVTQALLRMARIRGLAVKRPVAENILSRRGLIDVVKARVAATYPSGAIQSEGVFAKLLGSLGRDIDYERATFDVLEAHVGGYYAPDAQTLYVPADLAANEKPGSLAHEAVHALQDQHFDLAARERYVPGASDAMLAQGCLAEGDATSATTDFLLGHATMDDTETEQPASYIEREVVAPYEHGLRFVNALRRRGGWEEVNRAWTTAGLTTEQVLHPAKWLAHEAALDVAAPSFATLPGYELVWTDQRGELGVRLIFESWMTESNAARAAADWGGDRVVLVRNGSRNAVAWRIRYDSLEAAKSAANLVGAAVPSCSASSRNWAAMHVAQRNRDIVIVAAEATACGVLEKWANEALGSGS